MRSAAAEFDIVLRTALLGRLRTMRPEFFGRIVVQVLVAMGYGSDLGGLAEALGVSGDGGIHGLVDHDPQGLDRVFVEAKR